MPKMVGKRLLIADPDEKNRQTLAVLLARWGYQTEIVETSEDCLAVIPRFEPSIVMIDMAIPTTGGLELVRSLRGEHPGIYCILLATRPALEPALEAIKAGAFDYLDKPIDPLRLRIVLEKISDKIGIQAEVRQLRHKLKEYGAFEGFNGNTPVMQEMFHLIEQVAPSTASVLISGPSGTGKELVARAIHNLSPRKREPYVAINCSAIPATLLESELFGHEKGAFTGAIARKAGCFEQAHGGTLFLDEITEMPIELQSKFLRVLEERKFRRLGGKEEIAVDVRVIAASNRNFQEAIRQRRLREDLYYRLNVFHIETPPLSERADDIPLIARTFIDRFNKTNHKNIRGIDPHAEILLKSYAWPGNVRELKNTIERAVIVCDGDTITVEHLPPHITATPPRIVGSLPPQSEGEQTLAIPIGMPLALVERIMIEKTLEAHGGNKTKAAKTLGISLKTIHNKLHRYRH
ncbi:MAG: sigma-54-dependent Fis family transcriptional regulator, partial [Deltaproteobacteria bacterium]